MSGQAWTNDRCRAYHESMNTAQATSTRFMTIADILALQSSDAEAEMAYVAEGFGNRHGIVVTGTTVADIIAIKLADIERDTTGRYEALRASMMDRGQSAPIAVFNGCMLNGGHRLAMAILLGWEGLDVTDDFEASEDRAWNEANPRFCFA